MPPEPKSVRRGSLAANPSRSIPLHLFFYLYAFIGPFLLVQSGRPHQTVGFWAVRFGRCAELQVAAD